MTKQELEDQIDLWASAAERAWKAGFDACEINHATAHQGNTFLSRIWNKREDEYGPQNYENRTRFIRDIIVEAKRRCGPGFAVHAIINAAEYNHPLATTLEEGVEISKLICEVADGLNVRGERYGHRGGLLQPDRLMYPEPPVRPAQGPRLEPPGRRRHRAAGGGGQARGRQGAGVDGLPHRRRMGREVPARGQARLRGHDPRSCWPTRSIPTRSAKAGWRTSGPAWAACTASRCATATRSSSAG